VRFETRCGGKASVIGFEDVQRSGGSATWNGIDEYQCAPLIEKVVGEMHTPDSVVDRMHLGLGGPPTDVTHHLGSETVVSEEDVADAGYQYSGRDIASDPAVTCS
jgi:hypothetical protein